MSSEYYNIAERLTQMAKEIPDSIAIAEPLFQGKKPRRDHFGKREYAAVTFSELDQDSDRIAAVLQREGVKPGMRLALMVRQGIDFISLVFALYKTGATLVLIDPGMGVKRMLVCLREAELDGFVGVPEAHIARLLYRRWFPKAKHNLTVGKRYFWGGLSLAKIRKEPFFKPENPLYLPSSFQIGIVGIAWSRGQLARCPGC